MTSLPLLGASERYWPPVRTKEDFVVRYVTGEFGNMTPTWIDPKEFSRSLPNRNDDRLHNHPHLYHLRNRTPSGPTEYKLTPTDLLRLWYNQADRENWYASQQIPQSVEQRLRLQGEVMQSVGQHVGLSLYWTRVPLPMRVAMAQEAHQDHGVIALLLLQEALCPNSLEWLNALLDRYPGHVIEFSAYDCNYGTIPGYNTVFWEVRAY